MSYVQFRVLLGPGLDFLLSTGYLEGDRSVLDLFDTANEVSVELSESEDLLMNLTNEMYGRCCKLSSRDGIFILENFGFDICILKYACDSASLVQQILDLDKDAILEIASLSIPERERGVIRQKLGLD